MLHRDTVTHSRTDTRICTNTPTHTNTHVHTHVHSDDGDIAGLRISSGGLAGGSVGGRAQQEVVKAMSVGSAWIQMSAAQLPVHIYPVAPDQRR